MKETTSKKTKDVGVLLIAAVMVLSTVVVTADTNDESEFMLVSADIPQPQQTNTFDPDWIHFDDGTPVNAFGTSANKIEGGIRITPDELGNYDGWNLVAVKWYHPVASGTSQSHSGNIKIYDAGTSTTPGSLITSEPFTVTSPEPGDWEEIVLSNPVGIDASKDIWVSVDITYHATGEYPIACDGGPAVAGKGDWLYMNDVWQELKDISSYSINWNIWAKVKMPSEPPEKPQRLDGPTEGVVGVEYTFSTSTTDPEGENVSYWWEWDNGTPGEWTDPYDSGETVYASHIWTETGEYNITVKAKDPHGEESEWSDPKMIYIVDTAILEIGNITGKLFKVSTVIRNTGGVDATRVNWSITLDGGIILLSGETKGSILSIPAGDEKTISSSLIFGFGKTLITATAECDESSDTAERDAFVLLFFVL